MLDEERHVLHPLAERGQHDRDDVQPVVEILAEAAALHLALEVLVGRCDDADVHPDGAVAADALELALLQHAQDLGLRLEAHVADLVEQEGPAVGDLELAFARRRRAGEGPLLVAEELALDELPGEGRAVDLHERPAAAGAVVVEGVRDELLAGAARAAHQHGEVGVGHFSNHVEHPLHGGAPADDALELVGALDLLLQTAEVPPEGDALEDALDGQLELVVVERLWQVVGGAELHRFDRDLLRAEGGDHDDRGLRGVLPRPAEHVHAARLLEAQVRDHDVVRALREPAEGVLGRERGVHVVSAPGEQSLDGDADGALVVDDQDSALHCRGGPSGGRASGSSMRTVMPASAWLASSILPPCASTVRFAIASPSPVPASLRE